MKVVKRHTSDGKKQGKKGTKRERGKVGREDTKKKE